jgi:cystathionine gamma-lyase
MSETMKARAASLAHLRRSKLGVGDPIPVPR